MILKPRAEGALIFYDWALSGPFSMYCFYFVADALLLSGENRKSCKAEYQSYPGVLPPLFSLPGNQDLLIRKIIWQKAVGAVKFVCASCLISYDFTEIQVCLLWRQAGQVPVCLAQLSMLPARLVERGCCLWKTCRGWSCLPNSFPPPLLCREHWCLQKTTVLASRAAHTSPGQRCLARGLWQHWWSGDTRVKWEAVGQVLCSLGVEGWGRRHHPRGA